MGGRGQKSAISQS